MRGDSDHARKATLEYKELFEPGHFFLEVQSNGMAVQHKVNGQLAQLAADTGVPLVATADAHYIKTEDAKAHEYLMCIASGKSLSDQKRLKHDTEQLYVKSGDEMLAALPEYAQAIANAAEIGRSCKVELPMGKPMLPTFRVPDSFDEKTYLLKLAREGLDRRFGELRYPINRDQYRQQLEMELAVIQSCGFSGYFLIVQDFINWAKSKGIPVGPGRGSGAGSITAYSLRITDLDPIPYKLLFERFLNPERVSMPDFDVDFCQKRRDEVIGYVTEKYGKTKVGQIITFGSLKARSVIRDVVRVRGLPFAEGDRLAKLIPEGDLTMTLSKALEQEPRLKALYDTDPTIKEIIDVSLALEGLHRQAGMHAAGVVIADQPLWEIVPLYRPQGEDLLVTQFAKDEAEKIGLVKFDFLGLKTLDVIGEAVAMINAGRSLGPEAPEIRPETIPIDDPAIYELITRGETAGVFQLESSGFTDLVKRLKPTRFEDIIAAGALYRPGPLESGMVQDYIDRKHGRQRVVYPHASLEEILRETYGVIVYQEQVMQIAQALSGFTLGRADILRRAMGKKKPEEMEKLRGEFCAGAKARAVDERVAGEIFDLMQKFAGYGFNKSHSAAYAMVTVQTAWLKAHHPAEFMAALLSNEADNTDKIVAHIAEAREMGLSVFPPSVNESMLSFSARPAEGGAGGTIRFGLGGIKGVGEAAIQAILEARGEGPKTGGAKPFTSLFDFCDRVDLRRVNKKVLEALTKSGAFDELCAGAEAPAGGGNSSAGLAGEASPALRRHRQGRRSRSGRPARPGRRASVALWSPGGERRFSRSESRAPARASRRRRVDRAGAFGQREGDARLLHQRASAAAVSPGDQAVRDEDAGPGPGDLRRRAGHGGGGRGGGRRPDDQDRQAHGDRDARGHDREREDGLLLGRPGRAGRLRAMGERPQGRRPARDHWSRDHQQPRRIQSGARDQGRGDHAPLRAPAPQDAQGGLQGDRRQGHRREADHPQAGAGQARRRDAGEPRGVHARRGRGDHPAGRAAGATDRCPDSRRQSALWRAGCRAEIGDGVKLLTPAPAGLPAPPGRPLLGALSPLRFELPP